MIYFIVFVFVGAGFYFISRKLSVAPIDEKDKANLTANFDFYRSLPSRSKKIFEYRTAYFRKVKTFVPRNMDVVSDEMKLLISACAVQLTFGYPKIFLSYFKYIVVFPDQYFNPSEQRFHKGEVNPKDKAIVLSWKHFVQGYAFDDGINLGLHEMAHALRLENVVENGEFDFIKASDIKEWQNLAQIEINALRSGSDIFFRSYAGTNYAEFFAVAVEVFFEKPADFSAQKPNLYAVLSKLLKQDPLLLKTSN